MTSQSLSQTPVAPNAENARPVLIDISNAPVIELPSYLEVLDFATYRNPDGSHELRVRRVDTYPLLESVDDRLKTESYPIPGGISPSVNFGLLCKEARQKVLMRYPLNMVSQNLAQALGSNNSSDPGDLAGKTI